MAYQRASTAEVESVIDDEWGGMWFLKGALDTDHLGLTILELEPGAKGKEHDHSEDGQEEVYCCVAGTVEVVLDDEAVTLHEDEAIRVDAAETRQLRNEGDERTKLVIAGAPL